jgi:hypothetical protein
MTPVEQGGHQIGTDESGAAGDQYSAKQRGRRSFRILNHAEKDN